MLAEASLAESGSEPRRRDDELGMTSRLRRGLGITKKRGPCGSCRPHGIAPYFCEPSLSFLETGLLPVAKCRLPCHCEQLFSAPPLCPCCRPSRRKQARPRLPRTGFIPTNTASTPAA